MSLKETYARAWIKAHGLPLGWIVNLEPTYNLALGAVGVMSRDDFLPETTLERRGVIGLALDDNQQRQDTPWQFQSNEEISVEVGQSGQTSGSVDVVGRAAWDVTVNFGSRAGVSIHGTARWSAGYADLGVVRQRIVEAAREERLHKGESIVVQQTLSGPGVFFTSEGNNAALRVSANADVGAAGVPSVASLAGHLNLVRSSSGARFQSFAERSVLASRVLYLGTRGWLWWRDFAVFGAFPLDIDQKEEAVMNPVEGGGEDEYFALV